MALGGTSYAAARLPGNSVGPRQISSNAVGSTEIRRSAVGTSELRKGAVHKDDLGANSVNGDNVQDNSIGSAEVHDISLPDLNFRPLLPGEVTGVGSTRTNEVPVTAGGGFASVHDISVVAGPRGDRALLSAALEVTNPDDGNGPITVNSRVAHNGEVHHGTFSATLQDGQTATLPHYFECDEAPGTQVFSLEVEGVGKGNLLVGDRSLNALIGLL